jgi:uncharacterized membrane protein YfcA
MKVALMGIIAGIVNGLFGSGAGMVVLPVLSTYSEKAKARGTTMMSVLFLSIISSIFYLKNIDNQMELKNIWYVIAGGIIGGTLGSKMIYKIPIRYLQLLLAIFMIYTGIRIII